MKSLIGDSSRSSLRAAKTLVVPKAVYRLGNIDSVYSVDDVKEYIESLGVRMLTCFELPNSARQPTRNKAFRICIIADERLKLFEPSSWSVGVSLREWRHKLIPEGAAQNGRNMGSGDLITGGAVGEDLSFNRRVELDQGRIDSISMPTNMDLSISQSVDVIRSADRATIGSMIQNN